MSRPLRARVNLDAIRRNYAFARSLGRGHAVAIIKANAYGHGLAVVGEALAGADALGVATIEEALVLRRAGINGRLLVLEGTFDRAALREAVVQRLDIVIHSGYQLEMLAQVPGATRLRLWLKIDTGMGRLGFPWQETEAIVRRLRTLAPAAEITLMTHMACADEPDHDFNSIQLQRFDTAFAGEPLPASIANSAALLALPGARREWNRAGIMLWGVNPRLDGIRHPELRCTMELESALIAVRRIGAGETVGYGCDYHFPAAGRFGIVACGYGDGYPRHAPSGTPILVGGHRTRLVGRVSMDMLAVDLTHLPDAGIGTPVTLWGAALPVAEVAAHAGTIAYELLTGLTERVPRIYEID
ncbi:alanine racemase [Microbulbifer guangxiensis]|uniref:alanine racemase n=1 Tax=Microbulbifer guangxiensis TaxID=2904249 RepID=UPI001EFF9F6F|nr:alanine racemase [Microbulbifer guangxiensis]